MRDDPAGAGEQPHRLGQLALAEIGDLAQQRRGDLLADHRHRLHQRLLATGQPVDARCEARLDRRGQHETVQLGRQPALTANAGEVAVLGERLDDLLDEERVAVGARLEPRRQRVQRAVASEELGEQVVGRAGIQRTEAQLDVRRGARPGGLVLRPVGADQERPGADDRLDELFEKRGARVVDHVQVLDHQHRRLVAAARLDGTSQHCHEPVPAGLGIQRRKRLIGVLDAEELEQQRQVGRERGIEGQHRGLDPLAGDLGRVVLTDAEVVAVQREHRQQRHVAPVRDTTGRVDRQPARGAAGDELVHQAALAHARLADDPDRPPVPGQRALERGLQLSALGVATDEPRQPARGGHRLEARVCRPGPDQLQHALARPRALELELAQLAQLELAFDQGGGGRADRRRSRRGQRLDPLAQRGRVADRHEVHVHVVADRAHDHLAGVQPAPDRELHPVAPRQLRGQPGHLALELEHRQARAPRVVLVRERRAEDRQQAVTGELVDGPLERMDRGRGDPQEAIEDKAPALGVQRAGQLHRADDVGVHHRHLLALALDPRALLQDPGLERARRPQRLGARPQRGPALLAEPRARSRAVSTIGAVSQSQCLVPGARHPTGGRSACHPSSGQVRNAGIRRRVA